MASVSIGRIGRPHGLHGEVTLERCPLAPEDLVRLVAFTWRGARGEERSLQIEGARPGSGRLIVRFRGITDRDQARSLGLGELLTEADRLPDPGPGQAYTFQLIGLAVETEDGRRLGVLESVLPTGANPVFVLRGEREMLVPANEQTLKRVDLEHGLIVMSLPAGLEEL